MNEKKILVACTDYPDLNGKVTLMYIHVRNVYYKKKGLDVTVLNFRAKADYEIDNIKVITLDSYIKERKNYHLLICHAANLRNHYLFLLKNSQKFNKIVFFYHGHEVLKINKTYPKPYYFENNSKARDLMQDVYDELKVLVWKDFIIKNIKKIYLVFVSKWMLDEFLKSTKINFEIIKDNYMITYNCIGKHFEQITYDNKSSKEYDFLTIRSNLDGSKYAVDIVNELAKNNKNLKFLLYGKGSFFNHYKKADNLTWIDSTLNHSEITSVIQKCRCALMPTRTDAQGLMMCELASTGMPLITSDIPVCHEVFDDFDKVYFISNDDINLDLNTIVNEINQNTSEKRITKYFNENTSEKEVKLIELLCS